MLCRLWKHRARACEGQNETVVTAADVIATCALAFTLASFWLLYARAGKLEIVGEPRSYSFAASRGFIVTLPLVFTNARPLAAVAINVRLRLDTPGFPSIVPFVATRDGVKPEDTGRKMATSIVIQGRETRLVCCEFILEPFDVVLAGPISVPVTVEAFIPRRGRPPAWKVLLTFPLRLPKEAAEHRGQYLTYDNQAIDALQ